MNTIDYVFLAAFAVGALYTFCRLFVGCVAGWSHDDEVSDSRENPIPSRADNAVADFNRDLSVASAPRIPESNREHSNI